MRRLVSLAALALAASGFVGLPPAAANPPPVESFDHSPNMQAVGFSPQANTVTPFTANSDLAFWGKTAFQGHYDGFRVIDIRSPAHPRQISFQDCFGNQGDIVVWDNILVRSWNSPV